MNRALIERTIAAMTKGHMSHNHAEYAAVMEALKAELEKPEPNPAAWGMPDACYNIVETISPDEKEGEMKVWANQYSVPLYAAPTEPNCRFPSCHSQEYQDKLVQEILGQEPVAYMLTTRNFGLGGETWDTTEYRDYPWDSDCVPLYTKGTTNA